MTIAAREVDGLSDRDRAIVACLAAGKTPTEAAAELGVSAPTIYRRMSDPAFRAALAVAKAAGWAGEVSELRREFRRSVAHMVRVRDDESVHDATRMRAAVAICELSLRLTKEIDYDSRLAALELLAAGEAGAR